MPIQIKKDTKGCFARWGDQGKKYYYKCGSVIARNNAKKKANRQAAAIGEYQESFNDYPIEASENAKIALRWAEENGWGDCGTQVGKIRANQLANKEKITRDTIARMAAFERHRQNSDKELGDGCGRLMWLAWGGDAGIEWAQRKLKQIDTFNFEVMLNRVSLDYDDVLSTSKGKELAINLINEGKEVYIITRRQKIFGKSVYDVAKELGIPSDRVYFTNGSLKWEIINKLKIATHYDNSENELKKNKENTMADGVLFENKPI